MLENSKMWKPTWLVIVILCLNLTTFGQQNKTLNKAVEEFCKRYHYQHRYKYNQSIGQISQLSGMTIGYENWQIEQAINNLRGDYKYRESLFRSIGIITRFNQAHISLQLMGLGIDTTGANALADYIVKKYKGTITDDLVIPERSSTTLQNPRNYI